MVSIAAGRGLGAAGGIGDAAARWHLGTGRRGWVRAETPRPVDPQRVAIHGVEGVPGELAEVDFGPAGSEPRPGTPPSPPVKLPPPDRVRYLRLRKSFVGSPTPPARRP